MTGLPTHLRSRLFGARRATVACESRNGSSTTKQPRPHGRLRAARADPTARCKQSQKQEPLPVEFISG